MRWVEPGRRRRRRLPLLPFAILILLLAAGGAVAYVLHDRAQQHAELRDTAVRFARAWEQRKPAAMYRELDADARSKYSARRFTEDYREADADATVRKVSVSQIGEEKGGQVRMAVAVQTKLFGTLRGRMALPVSGEGDAAGVALELRAATAGPALRRGGRPTAPAAARRAMIAAADGSALDATPTAPRSPAAAARTRPGSNASTTPGSAAIRAAKLMFGNRVIARTKAVRGRPVHTTLRPRLMQAASQALGGKLGGVAVIRPRDGAVPALAGLAVSAPQPPGSTFKIITTSAALDNKVATPVSTLSGAHRGGAVGRASCATPSGESCGGSLAQSFIDSCNSVFAPLGAKVGARRLVAAAKASGSTRSRAIPGAVPNTISEPKDLKDDLAVGAAAIGQDRDLATPLRDGERRRDDRERRLPRAAARDDAAEGRAPPRRLAPRGRPGARDDDRRRARGTGTAAALPGRDVAGKTGTAELRPNASGATRRTPTPGSSPSRPPRARSVAVAVMLVGAGLGGKAAAPVAREVLSAAL